jgi:hypothetical protein
MLRAFVSFQACHPFSGLRSNGTENRHFIHLLDYARGSILSPWIIESGKRMNNLTILSFFTLVGEVKASQMKNDKLVHI